MCKGCDERRKKAAEFLRNARQWANNLPLMNTTVVQAPFEAEAEKKRDDH